MIDPTEKVFCSYASANHGEVIHFDSALRRHGVPLWRDKTNLAKGVLTAEEIELAAKHAGGFVFYLTREAAHSEWVREHERAQAVENAKLDSSFGIVPIFRHDRKEVSELMVKLGAVKGTGVGTSPYDLSGYNGYLMKQDAFDSGQHDDEFNAAAATVLRSLIRTKVRRAGAGATLRIGAMTRNGPLIQSAPLDLLIDWTAEFPPEALKHPHGDLAERHLLKALSQLGKAIAEEWSRHRGTRFQIVPQCHLSMALAIGYQFRRNTGAELFVLEPQSGEFWHGPRVPSEPNQLHWKTSSRSLSGEGLAVILGISRSVLKDAEQSITASSIDIGHFLVLEPTKGVSPTAIPQGSPEIAHDMAVSAVAIISELVGTIGSRPIHLFAAVPAAFAVLLGQQLSNVGPVQTYEWNVEERHYVPTFRLA